MAIRRQFLEWEWSGDLELIKEEGKVIKIYNGIAASDEFIIFDTFPFIMPIETPGWIQLKLAEEEIFGRGRNIGRNIHPNESIGSSRGIPTEWLYELRNKKNIIEIKKRKIVLATSEYLWQKLYVMSHQSFKWYYEFGEEVVRKSVRYEDDDDKFRHLFKNKTVKKRKKIIRFIAEIKRIKILIPYIDLTGADGIVAKKLFNAGILVTPEKVLDVRKNPHSKSWNNYNSLY